MSTRNKIDTSQPFFCAKRQAKEGTVFDTIRKVIAEHNNSILYDDLAKWLTANWKPEKAETYGPGYIRAYVTGGIKEGYITQDPKLSVDYSFRPKGGAKAIKAQASVQGASKPEVKEVAPKAETPKPTTTTAKTKTIIRNDVLQFIRGPYKSFEDTSEARITTETLAVGLGTDTATIKNIVLTCIDEGLLRVGQDGLIFLTREGFKRTTKTLTPA